MDSILQCGRYCYLCGLETVPLECHHVMNGNPGRKLSERYGLKVYLCPECHRKVHENAALRVHLKQEAQRAAQREYHWNTGTWLKIFYKNYL